MKPSLLWVRIGGLSLIVLGIARGGGGIILLGKGAATLEMIQASASTITWVSWGLISLGILTISSGIGVFLRSRLAWLLGVIVTICFVLDGALNGILLFGSLRLGGTIGNIVVAAFILAALWVGRSAIFPTVETSAEEAG